MDLNSLIQLLQNKIGILQTAKGQAYASGDLNQLNAIDKDLLETQNTITQLSTLAEIAKAAQSVNSSLASVAVSGISAVQDTTTTQGPSASAIINGYDVSAYATDPLYEQKIQTIINAMPPLFVIDDINVYIKNVAPGSPVTGEMVITAAAQYFVNIPLLVAIMQNDSQFGTTGVGARTNNPGNVGNTGFAERSYPTWADGVNAVADWLDRHRVNAVVQNNNGVQVSTVVAPVLTSVSITPTTLNITTGDIEQLTTNAIDQNGASLSGATISFSSNDTTVATVDNVGIVTAIEEGTATITASATLNGKTATGNSTIIISSPVEGSVLSSVTITPTYANILAGTTQQLFSHPLDHNGNLITGANITFKSNDTSVAKIDSDGIVTAISGGTANITVKATLDGNIATANSIITVSEPVSEQILSSVTVAPTAVSILAGATQELSASPLDHNGDLIEDATVTFISDNAEIATVDKKGVVTAISAGVATITAKASWEENIVTANSIITVSNPIPATVLSSVVVSPSAISMAIGAIQTLTTTSLDQGGSIFSDTTITFSSDNTSVATVDDDGLVTAISAGTANIVAKATYADMVATGNAVITVSEQNIQANRNSKTKRRVA